MKATWILALGAALGVAQATVFAGDATVPYNEAVRIVGGQRVVDLPPLPPGVKSHHWRKPSFNGGIAAVRVGVETERGLMDCAGLRGYHEPACEPSTLGRVKWAREWVVKINGKWQTCVGRLKPIKCVGLQDLWGLPTLEE